MNEMMDFLGNWCFAGVQTRCQTGNTAHNGVIAATDDHTFGGTFNGICREKGQIFRFQWIIMGEIGSTGLWFRFAGER